MSIEPKLTIEKLFEDPYLLAIHKPAGIPFHCDEAHQGVVQRVRLAEANKALFPVHRLDKMTSGLMVFAKTQDANKALCELLATKQIEKYYLALSAKKPNRKQGMVCGTMQKGRRGSYLLSRDKSNAAVTRFFAKPLKAVLEKSYAAKPYWFFMLKPETGKTHQLRVALKSLGSPILGDGRYGGEQADRGYLHACKMRFDLFGQRYDISDPFFCGSEFHYAELDEALSPLGLAWPKAAFRLPEQDIKAN